MKKANIESLRPFYFFVVVWGKSFCDYLTHYCIPSLLAPGNIPSLSNNDRLNKFLLCTTIEDWVQLKSHPCIIELQNYLVLEFIEIPPHPLGVSSCQHMGVGHKLATERCFQDRAYGIAITPDLLISDNSIKKIEQYALEGKQIIYCAVVRLIEEKLFQALHDANICQPRAVSSQRSLCISGRKAVAIAVDCLHSQTRTYDFSKPYYSDNAPITYWPIPEEGLLLHSLSWCPLLLDYALLQTHDTTSLESWTIDGDYVYKNFHQATIYVCQDSDEMMILGWSPESYANTPLIPGFLRRLSQSFCLRYNVQKLKKTLRNPIFDPMKIVLFPKPVYWHTEDINSQWHHQEAMFQAMISRSSSVDRMLDMGDRLYRLFCYMRQLIMVVFSAAGGDDAARYKIRNKLMQIGHYCINHKKKA